MSFLLIFILLVIVLRLISSMIYSYMNNPFRSEKRLYGKFKSQKKRTLKDWLFLIFIK